MAKTSGLQNLTPTPLLVTLGFRDPQWQGTPATGGEPLRWTTPGKPPRKQQKQPPERRLRGML